MKIEGKITCRSCGNEIEWNYQASQSSARTAILDVEVVPVNKSILTLTEKEERDNYFIPIKGKVRCRNCDEINDVEIKEWEL